MVRDLNDSKPPLFLPSLVLDSSAPYRNGEGRD